MVHQSPYFHTCSLQLLFLYNKHSAGVGIHVGKQLPHSHLLIITLLVSKSQAVFRHACSLAYQSLFPSLLFQIHRWKNHWENHYQLYPLVHTSMAQLLALVRHVNKSSINHFQMARMNNACSGHWMRGRFRLCTSFSVSHFAVPGNPKQLLENMYVCIYSQSPL